LELPVSHIPVYETRRPTQRQIVSHSGHFDTHFEATGIATIVVYAFSYRAIDISRTAALRLFYNFFEHSN
jgi:hypothetical protein